MHLPGKGSITRLRFAAAIAAAIASASPAIAGPVADGAATAEAQMADGDPAAAVAAFDQAAAAFWASSPLQLRRAIFAEEVKGFGQYEPRAAGPFKPGERATIYVEPFGYGFTPAGDGFRVALAADVEIRTSDGLILAKADDFGSLEWDGREKSREVHATIGIDLPPLKAGDYEIVLTLRDKATPKTTTATLPFSVAAP